MLRVLGNYDADLKFLVQNKGVYRGFSPEVQKDIIA
jgi:hypothetical protein